MIKIAILVFLLPIVAHAFVDTLKTDTIKTLTPCMAVTSDYAIINLKKLDVAESPRSIPWHCPMSFNPCTSISCGPFKNTAVCQRCSETYSELGRQDSARFYTDADDNVVIGYESQNLERDGYPRKAYVKCVCGSTEAFKYLGQVFFKPELIFTYELTSPCCCKNGCLF